ncbi:MAG TPA: DUF4340 domain-containing protein [Anaerolineales bacterium]|nr:DUF4340 domain-containing protein [Anaerolineales bacterium]
MRRSTIVYLVLLAIMIGLYVFLRNRSEATEANATPMPTTEIAYLFPAADGIPTGIRVQSREGSVVEVARNEENVWVLKQPLETAADQGSAEAAASQVTTMRILDRLTNVPAEAVGLASPAYILTVKFSSGAEHTVEIGDVTPTSNGYYVRTENGQIVIVSKYSVDALVVDLINNPPYAETPTPTLTPTETPLPSTPEPTPTSTETATPQP